MTRTARSTVDTFVLTLRGTMVGLVRRDGPDLTARQLAIFLTCYLTKEAQTVRGLAAVMRISKPAVTRSIDRLAETRLIARGPDPRDGRSMLLQKTEEGFVFMNDLRDIIMDCHQALTRVQRRPLETSLSPAKPPRG